jgi:hypothetical protein
LPPSKISLLRIFTKSCDVLLLIYFNVKEIQRISSLLSHPLTILSTTILTKSLPPIKVQISAPQEQKYKIAATERNQDPNISPPRVEADRKRLIELVPNAVSAVRAVRSRVVGDVARAAAREERLHIISARLSRRGGEEVEFRLGAGHGEAVEFSGDETGD